MGKSGGISQNVTNAETGLAEQTAASAKQVSAEGQQEFNTSFPGFQQAENYYQQLATGDPGAISRAIAPAAQQIDAQSTASAQRIEQDSPRGGVKNLALEENQINKGAQIGNLASQSYLSSFQNLAGLAGQGIGESISSTGTGLQGLSSAGNQYSNIANQQAEGKASQLGFIGSLAGSGAEIAGACWVAVALWGEASTRTILVRYYFNQRLRTHWFGKYAYALYLKYGQRAAARLPHSWLLRTTLSAVFSGLFRMAGHALPVEEQRIAMDQYWGF